MRNRRVVWGARVIGAACLTTLVATAVVACGSDDDDTSGGHDAGALDATAHDGGATSPDAAPGPDATSGDASSADAGDAAATDGAAPDGSTDAAIDAPFDAASEPVQGEINLVYGYGGPGGPPGLAQINFVQTSSIASTTCTTTAVAGGCTFTSCPDSTITVPTNVEAGTGEIDLSFLTSADAGDAGGADAGLIVFVPSDAGPGQYIAVSGFTPPFTDRFSAVYGDSILTKGLGDPASLGPFALQSILPGRLTVTAPPLTFRTPGHEGAPGSDSASFPRGVDLTMSWTGGIAGTIARIVFTTTSSAAPNPRKSLVCDFDQTATTVTIPSQNGLMLLDDVSSEAGAMYGGSLQVLGRASAVVGDGTAAILETVTVDPAVNIFYTNTD